MIVLDTDVVSELDARRPSLVVLTWLNGPLLRELFVTAMTEAKVGTGVAFPPEGRHRWDLAAVVERACGTLFPGSVLLFDGGAARDYVEFAVARRAVSLAGRSPDCGNCQGRAAWRRRPETTRTSRTWESTSSICGPARERNERDVLPGKYLRPAQQRRMDHHRRDERSVRARVVGRLGRPLCAELRSNCWSQNIERDLTFDLLREQLLAELGDSGANLGYDGKAIWSHSTGSKNRVTGATSDADWTSTRPAEWRPGPASRARKSGLGSATDCTGLPERFRKPGKRKGCSAGLWPDGNLPGRILSTVGHSDALQL